MNRSHFTFLSLITLVIVIGSACSSGKSALEHGNYYDAVITSINRLRRNTDNKKSSETLRAAYPMAVRYYEDRANTAASSSTEFKWREVVQHYSTLHSMYDEIQRSPGALRVIPNPTNYQAKLADARQKAAEESYAAGIMALGMGDRANAKKAFYLFGDANNYAPGYKDVIQRMEDARMAATVKVAVEPIPVVAKNYALDAHYFDSKLNEYLQSNQPNEFVRYYKLADARTQKINPDHIVQLSFEEFSIGQVYLNEKESQVERDSIVVAYTFTDTKGNFLQKDISAPKIIPPVTDDKKVSTGGSVDATGKTEDKKITDTKTVDVVVPTKKEEKPEDKKPEEPKPADTTKSDGQVVITDKNDDKPADKQPEDKKGEEDKNTDKGQGDKKDEKPADKQPDDKNNDKSQGDKKDEKPADNKPADTKTDVTNKDNGKADEKKEDAGKSEEKVTICHQPPGNVAERKTLTVPQSAVKAHLDHGDVLGECKSEKKEDKGKDNKGNNGHGDDGGMASIMPVNNSMPILIASSSSNQVWYLFNEETEVADTTKIYGKVKATVRHYKKTITSRGILNFRIIDAKTRAVISEQRMPSESVWVSEWLTYNGDSRALTPEQLNLATKKEMRPPTNQDLFAEFTKPLFDQITTKINEFYKRY